MMTATTCGSVIVCNLFQNNHRTEKQTKFNKFWVKYKNNPKDFAKMLRITTTILPLLTKPTNFLKCATYLQSNNLIRFYSKDTEMNAWMQTLDEAQQKRIRFIQNEVNFRQIDFRYKEITFFVNLSVDIAAAWRQKCSNIRQSNQGWLWTNARFIAESTSQILWLPLQNGARGQFWYSKVSANLCFSWNEIKNKQITTFR